MEKLECGIGNLTNSDSDKIVSFRKLKAPSLAGAKPATATESYFLWTMDCQLRTDH